MMSLLFTIGEDHMKGRRKGWYKFEKKNSNVGQYQNTNLHDYIIEYQKFYLYALVVHSFCDLTLAGQLL
jgi:hypothetical protein